MWLCIIDLPSHSHLLVSCSLNHPGAEPATKHVCELLPAVCRVGPVQTLLPTSHSELGQSRNLPPAADISQNTSSLAVSAMPSVYRYSSHWDKYHHKHCNYSTNTSPAPTPVRVFGPWWSMWTSLWPGGYYSKFSFKDNRHGKPTSNQALFCPISSLLFLSST